MPCKLFEFKKLETFYDRKCLIYRATQNEEQSYTYGEVIALSQTLRDVLKKINARETRISLQCPHSPELCIILLSLLNSECSFCAISNDADEDEAMTAVRTYGSPFLISHICFSENSGSIKLVGKVNILSTEFYIFHVLNDGKEFQGEKLPHECYSIKTSGSTGIAKVVRVPYQCISPNIKGLRDLLEITSDDIIFLSSPITFDPFVVEFFLAMMNGASLFIIDSGIRVKPYKLAEILQPKLLSGASVVQMTPSLFRLFGSNVIQQIILNVNTSLRILLLGGEQFPSIEEISHWTAENHHRTRIFNVYGITEVSCWSTLHEVKRLQTEKCIPIGVPIDSETQIRLVNDRDEHIHEGFGNIQIGSATRKCLIDNESQTDIISTELLFRSTGDIGYICEGKIFYEGRQNEIIKRYGHRVHTGEIAKAILAIDGVLNSCCVFNDDSMKLVCFVLKSDEKASGQIRQQILRKLIKFEKPDDIKFVDHFPVTSHGKISKKKLLHLCDGFTNNTPIQIFERFITNVLCLDVCCHNLAKNVIPKKRKVSLDLSFLDAGGTSFQALTLSREIEDILQHSEPKLLEMLLNGTTMISAMMEYISKISLDLTKVKISTECVNSSSDVKDLLKLKWEYDTGKCVDSTPGCYGNVVCVGSHSHRLITLDSKSGREVSTCILPDRIECQVCFLDHRLVLVGCYDGNLYVVDYTCGKIEWKFDCGGMIKAMPLRNQNMAVIGNYSVNGNLICLNLYTKSVLWKVQIGSKGIFASPLQINTKSLLACTLAGETVCVKFDTGHIVWKTAFRSPIFSTPAILDENSVIVAEVNGVVHCLDTNLGTELWNIQTDGNIFSGIIVHNIIDKKSIIFGNHDHNVYCLKSALHPSIEWKSSLNSAVYSTPNILHMPDDIFAVLSCSIKGGIYILDFATGIILFTMNLDNEIFSSPYIIENRIYVGCRNNNLVCLELQCEK